MDTYDLRAFLAMQEARKAALGIMQTDADIDALRNPGDRRTVAKRDLLRRTAARAAAAGLPSVKSNY